MFDLVVRCELFLALLMTLLKLFDKRLWLVLLHISTLTQRWDNLPGFWIKPRFGYLLFGPLRREAVFLGS